MTSGGGRLSDEECDAINVWGAVTADRTEAMQELQVEIDEAVRDGTATEEDMLAYADEVEEYGEAQARGVIPPAVQEINDNSVEMYRLTARALRSIVNGTTGWSADYAEVERLWASIQTDIEAVGKRCGFVFSPPAPS